MKTCLANLEGETCNFPVVAGGRCEFHQVGRAAKSKERISMKKSKRLRFDKKKYKEQYRES